MKQRLRHGFRCGQYLLQANAGDFSGNATRDLGNTGIGRLGMDKDVFMDSWIYTSMFSFMFVSISVFIYIYLFNIIYVSYMYIYICICTCLFIHLFIYSFMDWTTQCLQPIIYIGWISERVLRTQDYEFSCVQD